MTETIILSGENLHKVITKADIDKAIDEAIKIAAQSGRCADIIDMQGRYVGTATPKGARLFPWRRAK